MNDRSDSFDLIPAEYYELLLLAESKRESKIIPRAKIEGGRSGALLYLIDEILSDSLERTDNIDGYL